MTILLTALSILAVLTVAAAINYVITHSDERGGDDDDES